MKTLIFIIIFFMMYLIIQHIVETEVLEGLDNCSQEQHDLTYKNTATIEQQQTEINDFKKKLQERLRSLQTEVTGFNTSISKNKTDITTNATAIKSSVQTIHDAAKNKQAQLDKAGAGL